jgi:hypothetical protein
MQINRRPRPRNFTHAEEFIVARMDFAAAALPQVTDYDSYAERTAKRAAIAQAREYAREEAWEDWDAFIECATEAYDRGIGPAWA